MIYYLILICFVIEIAVVVDYVIVLVNAIVIDQLEFKINVCYNITVKNLPLPVSQSSRTTNFKVTARPFISRPSSSSTALSAS